MNDQFFACPNLDALRNLRQSILATLERGGYAVVRGLFDEAQIAESLDAVYRYANSARHHPSSGLSPADVRRNTSKWSIGGRAFENGLARFALVVYNPLLDSDIFHLHSTFDRIIQVRDTIAGRAILRDDDLMPERFNACRVQIYPAGGGFIAEHRDIRGQSNLPSGIYIEVILLLTQKGADYKTGGGFVRFKESVLDVEAGTRRGDLILYDAATVHGVVDVDSELNFDPCNVRGRAVAFATIYDNH